MGTRPTRTVLLFALTLLVLALLLVVTGCGSATTTTTVAPETTTTAAAATTTTAGGGATTTAPADTTTTAAAQATGKTIAVICATATSAPNQEVLQAFYPAAKALGLNVLPFVDANNDYTKYTGLVDDAIAKKVDALALVIAEDAPIQTALQHAQAAGIPVFGIDTPQDPLMVFTTISDDVAIGAQMMQELATLIGGKGNIYMFHDPSYGLLVNREKGAQQVLDKYPDIHVVQKIQIQPVNTLGVGRDNWQNILTAHPTEGSIAGLWSPADEASVGAAQAEWAAKRTEIPIVSCDGTPDGLAEMKKAGSPLKYEVVQDFAGQSQGVAKVISDYFSGTKPANNVQTYASILVTEQQVQSGQYPPATTTPTT